jgi:MerR family mercuric resistance operon transcriptional regulator
MPTHAFTISKLAKGAGVNVETIRYYQRRGLLEEPTRVDNGFRAYDERHLQRLLFIKRVQELGFSLEDAAELASLSQTEDRERLRAVARARSAEIRERIDRLDAMASALEHLAETCSHTGPGDPCPIVAALRAPSSDGSNQHREPHSGGACERRTSADGCAHAAAHASTPRRPRTSSRRG